MRKATLRMTPSNSKIRYCQKARKNQDRYNPKQRSCQLSNSRQLTPRNALLRAASQAGRSHLWRIVTSTLRTRVARTSTTKASPAPSPRLSRTLVWKSSMSWSNTSALAVTTYSRNTRTTSRRRCASAVSSQRAFGAPHWKSYLPSSITAVFKSKALKK